MGKQSSQAGNDAVEQLFGSWLAQRELASPGADQADGFAAFCALHPEHATELRRLHDDWRYFAELFDRLGMTLSAEPGGTAQPADTTNPSTSLGWRLRAKYGPGIDPGIMLEPEGDATPSSEFSAEALARLSARLNTSGRYHIQGEVDRGGQGVVLRVWDEELHRHLAMKLALKRRRPEPPSPDGADGSTSPAPPFDVRTIGRLLEEAQVTGQLDHPGIVPVHELGLDEDGRVFFTMKLVRGEDLRSVFARVHRGENGWTKTRVLSMVLRACEALSYAHSKRVVHRDLKPSNIMVGRYGEVFVMDWGLARVLDRKDMHDVRIRSQAAAPSGEEPAPNGDPGAGAPLVTMEGDVLGTPAYMAPEQAAGQLDRIGPASDVYAMGAILYQLITGRMPYVNLRERIENHVLLERVKEGPPARVSSLVSDAPPELVAICEKAMSREPGARYADMSALADDLRAYLEGRVVRAYETGAVAELRKWITRNKPMAASLAAAVLLLVAGLTASLLLERVAARKASDVLSLSAIQELDDLVSRADALWPASPEMLPAFERWLADARLLVDGSDAHPGLKQHEAKLAEIRKRALPITPERLEQDRRASPAFAQWQANQGKLTWLRRMLGDEPWPSEADVEASLAREALPQDAGPLNAMAWPMVDMELTRIVYGDELKGLLLARRALAVANDAERGAIRDTLAWALFRCGRLNEALPEEELAVSEADGSLKKDLSESLGRLREHVAAWAPGEQRERRAAETAELSTIVASLEPAANERQTYEFADAQDRWWHAQLVSLVAALKALTDDATGLDSTGTSEEHGWGIAKRVEFARGAAAKSLSSPEARSRWSEAIDAIATSPLYGGLRLSPQFGLLPIGPDRASGLWEFWHVQSGDEPVRGTDGKLVMAESTGIVLVLIPGGTFWMGAQHSDPAGRHFDPQARDEEAPVHQVTLSAYFLSKYEMTQGQWTHFVGRNPSNFFAGGSGIGGRVATLIQPVEQVSWNDAAQALLRLGLQLPTEAQWERGARAGTDTRWSSGEDRDSLRGAANLADQAAAAAGIVWLDIKDWPELNDGWAAQAPVGSYLPNAFGMHDVHGNIWEWCRDGFDPAFYAKSPASEPLMDPSGVRTRVCRGGSLANAASFARSSSRNFSNPEASAYDTGVRPARQVAP